MIGEFQLTKVVDGDTIRVDGLDSSLRLLGIDTEETFKNEASAARSRPDWQTYLKETARQRRPSARSRYATPLGEDAKVWAEQLFEGVDKVRLERDHPAEIRDRYNRYLAYVFAQKNGAWVNYNVEAVRAGMAPYFPKYGQSRRFHDDFVAAEAEAKAAHRGIWAPGVMAYPDYPEREAWWTARGDFVDAFRTEGEGKTELHRHHALGRADAARGACSARRSRARHRRRRPDRREGPDARDAVAVAHGRLPADLLRQGRVRHVRDRAWKGEFVIVTGMPSIYENKTHATRSRCRS